VCAWVWAVVCGALAGILGALFGAGGPAVILLFAYLNGREDLGTSPDALRSTSQRPATQRRSQRRG